MPPRGLKPRIHVVRNGAAEAAPVKELFMKPALIRSTFAVLESVWQKMLRRSITDNRSLGTPETGHLRLSVRLILQPTLKHEDVPQMVLPGSPAR